MPVGMETDIQIKASNGQVSVDEAQGIVECFVAAIGNKDSVGDIIQPGAFAGSLQRRKPRVVWGHNWNDPIGKVLDIQEVGPNDPRLPEKMKAGGVGGLYARVQFNLNSEKGKEAFANIAFYGEEQEWSIGYKTINATFDPVRQANLLHEVELYECSPVLHGANQLTGTISVKGAEAAVLERTNTQDNDLEFAFDDLYEKDGMLAMMPVETPRTENLSDQHDRKLELELQSRSPQPIKLISAADCTAVFQVQRSDNGTAMYRVHFHYHPERGFMLGQPERVAPQMVYVPFKPPGVQAKPQMNPVNRYEQSPADAIMPRIMRIVQKLDTDDSEKGDQLVISCKLEDAFATKSLLDPIIEYHGAIAEVTEEGIIIKSGATPDFIKAVETATKALGQRLGRGLLRGGGGGLGKVRRAASALRGFDPDSRDADLDFIVQEGTPWERPALPRKPGPSRGFSSSRNYVPRRLMQGRNWDEEEAVPDAPTPDVVPEGVGAGERPPSKARMGEFARDEYEAFLAEQVQKIIKGYGIEDVSDPLYPHPALTEFYNFDTTELVPVSFFDDMPGNLGASATNGWDDEAAARAGEMRTFELENEYEIEALDKLTEDIRANGIKNPLIVQYDPETGDLALDEGNHRLAAAQRLGMQVVPVRMTRQTSSKRRGIRGPRKNIPTQTNSRGDLVTTSGELLAGGFRPSDIGIDTHNVSPEMRRLQMLVAARGGSRQQAARRKRRFVERMGPGGGLESTRNRFDLRAAGVSPDREGGRRMQRGARRTPEPARDERVVWNRETETGLASRRAADLRSQGFNEREVTALANPPPMKPAGLASMRNFHGQDSHRNLRDLIDAREAMLDFLVENPHFDATLGLDYDLDTRKYPSLEEFPGGETAWNSLMDDWDTLRTEYDNILSGFREENQYFEEAIEKRNEIANDLNELHEDLKGHVDTIVDKLAPRQLPDGTYVIDDTIKEFLENDDYDGLRALFTPEYVVGEHGSARDRAGYFENLEIDDSDGKPFWESSLEYEWNAAKDLRKDIEEKEQEHYSAETLVSQHSRNGQDEVLKAAEKVDNYDRNMRIETRPDESMVARAADLEPSKRLDATTGSLERFEPTGQGLRSQRGRGLGENFEIPTFDSTAISHAHYRAGDEELVLTFKGGRTYTYGGITPDVAALLLPEHTSSLGETFNDHIKGTETYLIKPDGKIVDRIGYPTELPTLGEKLKKHAGRLRDHRGLDRGEAETFNKAQKILDGKEAPPADPTLRSMLVDNLHSLGTDLRADGEPHAAELLENAAVAIRDDPRNRVNAHHGGRMEVSLSEEEVGEISDGLKSTRAKYEGHPNIERGLTAYDEKLRDAKGGKVSLDSAEYNQILESYARLEAIDPHGYFKPGRDVLEMAAFSKKGKWVSPNVAKDSQFPDRPHGFASRRPNNGAPADITPRLQGDLMHWARQQGGFHVVQELVGRYDRGGEQLSPRDWIRLHNYYANHSPAGRGMAQHGERRGLRSSRKKPEKPAMDRGGMKERDTPVGLGPGHSRFLGQKWEDVRPENWDELNLEEQRDELMVNFNPRSSQPQLFDWPPAEERLRTVDYDRILNNVLEQIQTQEERVNPNLAVARRRRERRQRIADAAKPKSPVQRRQARTQEDSYPVAKQRGERGFQEGLAALDPGPGTRRRRLLDPEGGRDIGDEVGKPMTSPDEQAAMDRRLRIMDSLDINIGTKRNALAAAAMDDRADESHVEFWDSLQDTLDTDDDLTFDMIERLGIQIDDYLENQTGRTLTSDEDRSMTYASRLRDHVQTMREEYEEDKFITRGDPFVEDVDDTARRWVGTEAAPEGDDAPDDPQGTAQVSRETEPAGRIEREPAGTEESRGQDMAASRAAANAVREDRDAKRRERALQGGRRPWETADEETERVRQRRRRINEAKRQGKKPEDEIEDLGGAFRSRRGDRETRQVARDSKRRARDLARDRKRRSKREEKRRQRRDKQRAEVDERIAAREAETSEEKLKRRRAEEDVMGQMNPVRTPWGFSSRRDNDFDRWEEEVDDPRFGASLSDPTPKERQAEKAREGARILERLAESGDIRTPDQRDDERILEIIRDDFSSDTRLNATEEELGLAMVAAQKEVDRLRGGDVDVGRRRERPGSEDEDFTREDFGGPTLPAEGVGEIESAAFQAIQDHRIAQQPEFKRMLEDDDFYAEIRDAFYDSYGHLGEGYPTEEVLTTFVEANATISHEEAWRGAKGYTPNDVTDALTRTIIERENKSRFTMTPDEVDQFRSQGLLWQEVANLGIDSMTTDDVKERSARLGGRNAYGKWAQDRRDQIGLRQLEREVERYKKRRGLASRRDDEDAIREATESGPLADFVRSIAEMEAETEGISLEEAERRVAVAMDEMLPEMVDRLQGIEPTAVDAAVEGAPGQVVRSELWQERDRRLNPGHYANAPQTGTGEVWPHMSRQGSYDLMGGANYAGSEDFVGTLSDAIDQWMENRGGGPSGARTPLWGDGLEPNDPVIWTYSAYDVDGDGFPLLTRSDVEAAFEARGIPSGGDLDETRNRDRIEGGPEDTRSAQEIFDAEYTQGPTGEPGASSADFYPVDLDTLDEEVQGARAHYRAMVEEPEQDVISVEDQLGVGGEIESLHRTRPHELSDMSIDELNKIGAFWLEQPSAGSRENSPPGRSIRQELEVRDEVEKLRADFEGSDRQRMISLRDQLSGEFGIGDRPQQDMTEQEFDDAVIVFRALSRLAEDGVLDGVPGLSEDGEDVPDLETQVKMFGADLYGGIGPAPGLERGSPEATMALFGRGRYLKENYLHQILDYPSPQTADLQDWKTTAWQMLAFRELARREARDFDLNIPKEQRSQFDRSLRARAALAPEPMGKKELVALAMRRLRLAENERDEARLGQQFGDGLTGAVSDRHYLDDVEGRPRSETPAPTFAEGDEIRTEDIQKVIEGPLMRRPDDELHARAMETPKERSAGKRTAEEEADERLDELISSVEELIAPRNRFEEVPGRGEPAAFEPEPGARRGDAFMSRRDGGLASHRDMSKQRAARNPKDRSLITQSSPFFKIIYDSLGVEIKKERDPVKRKALEKLKKSFEYFNSSSIRYGPDNPFQTSDGELQIDNDAIPDITDALFDVLGRWTRKSTVSEIDRKQALIDYLEAIDEVGGRTHPEVESMMPLRIAAVEKFLQKLVERGMDIL